MSNFFGGAISQDIVNNPAKKDEFFKCVQKPNFYLEPNDELALFQLGYEKIRDEYLSHHALSERNQWILFKPEMKSVLLEYIEHWVLASMYEAQICEDAMAGVGQDLLMKYIDFHNFADVDNEKYLFEDGMTAYRRFYIAQTSFHVLAVEEKLFLPEFRVDLNLYLNYKRPFFPQNEAKLKAILAQLK